MIDLNAELRTLFRRQWMPLHDEDWDADEQLRYPGVYLLAFTNQPLKGRGAHVDHVYYVGMSNSAGGVRGRMEQFKHAIEKGGRHSGGKNFYKWNAETPFSKCRADEKFYFAALCFPCTSVKADAKPRDFRTMGHVACLEYYALAHVLAKGQAKKVPPLNRSAGGVLVGAADEPTSRSEGFRGARVAADRALKTTT